MYGPSTEMLFEEDEVGLCAGTQDEEAMWVRRGRGLFWRREGAARVEQAE